MVNSKPYGQLGPGERLPGERFSSQTRDFIGEVTYQSHDQRRSHQPLRSAPTASNPAYHQQATGYGHRPAPSGHNFTAGRTYPRRINTGNHRGGPPMLNSAPIASNPGYNTQRSGYDRRTGTSGHYHPAEQTIPGPNNIGGHQVAPPILNPVAVASNHMYNHQGAGYDRRAVTSGHYYPAQQAVPHPNNTEQHRAATNIPHPGAATINPFYDHQGGGYARRPGTSGLDNFAARTITGPNEIEEQSRAPPIQRLEPATRNAVYNHRGTGYVRRSGTRPYPYGSNLPASASYPPRYPDSQCVSRQMTTETPREQGRFLAHGQQGQGMLNQNGSGDTYIGVPARSSPRTPAVASNTHKSKVPVISRTKVRRSNPIASRAHLPTLRTSLAVLKASRKDRRARRRLAAALKGTNGGNGLTNTPQDPPIVPLRLKQNQRGRRTYEEKRRANRISVQNHRANKIKEQEQLLKEQADLAEENKTLQELRDAIEGSGLLGKSPASILEEFGVDETEEGGGNQAGPAPIANEAESM